MDFLSDEDTCDLLNTPDETTQVGSMSQYYNFFDPSEDIIEYCDDDQIND